MNVYVKITFSSLHNIACSYFVLYQSTATIIVNFNSASFDVNDLNMHIGHKSTLASTNTLVLIVLKQCSKVYPYSILLLKQISIRRIIQFRKTDFTRMIDR